MKNEEYTYLGGLMQGIGSLLTDGIGDTLRVSLTEDAVREVPVAYRLSNPFQPSERSDDPVSFPEPELSYDPLKFSKRQGGDVLWRAPGLGTACARGGS